jgi:hypothetical protein
MPAAMIKPRLAAASSDSGLRAMAVLLSMLVDVFMWVFLWWT